MERDEELEEEVNDLDNFGDDEDFEETVAEGGPEAEEPPVEGSAKDTSVEPSGEVVKKPEDPPADTPPVAESNDDIITSLRNQINEQHKKIMEMSKGKVAEDPEAKKQHTPAELIKQKTEAPKVEEVDYLEGIDIDDVTSDPKIFNKVLSNVVTKAVEAARHQAVKDTLLSIPQVISSQIQQQAYIDTAVKTFYETHEDLISVKETVAAVCQGVAAEHPDWTIENVFGEAATRTRKLLKLPEFKKQPEDSKKNKEFLNPAFAAKGGRRQTKTNVSALQAELDEL